MPLTCRSGRADPRRWDRSRICRERFIGSHLFDFDQYNVDVEDGDAAKPGCLVGAQSAVRVTLEGMPTSVETRDYNIALGERRANSAKNYLATLGVDQGGSTSSAMARNVQPRSGRTKEAYAKNRRGGNSGDRTPVMTCRRTPVVSAGAWRSPIDCTELPPTSNGEPGGWVVSGYARPHRCIRQCRRSLCRRHGRADELSAAGR